jgi:hypothetical protein
MSVSQASVSRKGGEIGGLVAELQAIADDATKVFGGLSPAQLNWKPSAEQWSVGQCFEHLIKTNRGFIPSLEEAARGARKGNLWERVSPLSGLFGRVLVRTMSSRRKFKAPRGIKPTSSDVDAGVVGKFVGQQDELAGLMSAAAAGADLRRTVVTSPIAGFVTYSMLDACRIVIAHNRRHFAQAQRVTEAQGFPAA